MANLRNNDIFFFKKNDTDHFNQLIITLRQLANDLNFQAQRSEADAEFLRAFFVLIKALETHYHKHPKTALRIAKASEQFFTEFQRLRNLSMMSEDTPNFAQVLFTYGQACQQSRVGLDVLEAVSFVMLAAITTIGLAVVATLMGAHIGFILAGLSGAAFTAVLMMSLSAAPAFVMGIVTAIETSREDDWQQLFHPHDDIQGYTDQVIEKASGLSQ